MFSFYLPLFGVLSPLIPPSNRFVAKKTFATFAAEGGIKGEQCNEALLEKEKQQMTPAQVLLTASIAVAVGFWGGFDLGYTLGHDAGKRGAK